MEDDRNMSLPSMDSLLGFGIGVDVSGEPLLGYESQPLPDDVLAGIPSLDWPELLHEQVRSRSRAVQLRERNRSQVSPPQWAGLPCSER